MKISSSTTNYINQTYANQGNTAAKSQTPARTEKAADEISADTLNISTTTRDLQKISAAMDTEPADRTKLVADLRQQVQTNQYTVNAEQVAEKMVGSIMDKLG
ncbi:MAG: flagellar biosynthesis anti-sigma factor FlgM [Proteobacteria bacterium]|nr:flagellar biosynthesis anti-sigma factor FlgM [Pseudomonadota bacterium]